jgi:hypothetical protein
MQLPYLLACLAVHSTNTRWWQATETAGGGDEFAVQDLAYTAF